MIAECGSIFASCNLSSDEARTNCESSTEVRCSFGDNSLELVRAELDIASSWALRGMWANVSEKIIKVDTMLAAFTSQYRFMNRLEREARQAIRMAKRVGAVFDCLRDHVKAFCGQIL